MFFRQIITTSGNSFKAAGHMVPSGDDPDTAGTPDTEPSLWAWFMINF